ncbi:hypothetical protein [Streptomyces sp. AS02]|uniref:hypothetical protein n=1 Tax=Streptomyces sp. AS02 TaxID=2938946 RepID=UPI00201FE44B|nr:hypothetical protein [Streptomyces sp. AS02]MCL8011811.1 hypothetical protein [Streptomyces sp. AS02]
MSLPESLPEAAIGGGAVLAAPTPPCEARDKPASLKHPAARICRMPEPQLGAPASGGACRRPAGAVPPGRSESLGAGGVALLSGPDHRLPGTPRIAQVNPRTPAPHPH